MVLAKAGYSVARLLQTGTHLVTPSATLRTSSALLKYDENRKWHWWNWFYPFKIEPEYDEKGEPLEMPNFDDMAVGMWKKEVDARRAGNRDPIGLMPYWYAEGKYDGSKVDPIMVPSCFESRLISCLCEPEAQNTMNMWLHQNEPARCSCGYWFLLYYREPFVEYTMPNDEHA